MVVGSRARNPMRTFPDMGPAPLNFVSETSQIPGEFAANCPQLGCDRWRRAGVRCPWPERSIPESGNHLGANGGLERRLRGHYDGCQRTAIPLCRLPWTPLRNIYEPNDSRSRSGQWE